MFIIISLIILWLADTYCQFVDKQQCQNPEIRALDKEVELLLDLSHGSENLTDSDNLIRISDDLINILSTSQIFPNDVSSVANILDGVIMYVSKKLLINKHIV